MNNKKDEPGPVMVSDTLCPAVHILNTKVLCRAAAPKGTMSCRAQGRISVRPFVCMPAFQMSQPCLLNLVRRD